MMLLSSRIFRNLWKHSIKSLAAPDVMAKTLTVYCITVCKMRCVCQAHLTIEIGSAGVCYQLHLLWRQLIHKVVNGMIKFCLDYRGCRKLVFAKYVL